MGPLAIASAIIAAMVSWLVYLQREDARAAEYVHALEQRLASHATRTQMTRVPGQVVYTCTARNGFIYTAPTEADLQGLCEGRT
ncbi:butyryl-CoA dehydrogenase (plasmid) [Ralstonia solanacearum]|nr:butyryl-CoA dehydrogenase [Ralstonia solanacearum]